MSSGTVVKRGENSWRLKYDISPDPISGERRTRYFTFRGSKRDAQTRLAKLISEADDGIDAAPASETFGTFIDKWMTDTIKPAVRASTYEGYEAIVYKHVIPALGRIKLKDIRATHIQTYYSDKAKGGLASQTIVHHHRRIFQALKFAYLARLIPFNPAEAVKPPKVQREEIVVLSGEELRTLLDGLEGRRFWSIVFLAACTGMRRSEILGLRWCDLDIETSHLAVNRALEQTKEFGLQIVPPKTKSSRRRITLPAPAIEMLKRLRLRQDEEFLALGIGRDNDRHVFTRKDGEWYSPRSISKEFQRSIADMDITQITFHGLRHTHITHLLRDNVNLKVVSARAGHASVSITLDIYGHLIDGMETSAADAVERWFGSENE